MAAWLHAAILIASGRPAAMGQLFQACTGMSGYSRRGRGASGPPMGTSKHCRAGATTGSNAPLCPPAAPALGRFFFIFRAMMALAQAEIAPISGVRSLSGGIHTFSSVSQNVFPGPHPLHVVLVRPKKSDVFPEGHFQGHARGRPLAGIPRRRCMHAAC